MEKTKVKARRKLQPGDRGTIDGIEFFVGSGNVFADLDFDDAEEMLAKSRLAGEINQIIEKKGWDQTTAAAKLGTHQPVISALKRGRLKSITYDRLLAWLVVLGRSIEIKVARSPKPRVAVAIGR